MGKLLEKVFEILGIKVSNKKSESGSSAKELAEMGRLGQQLFTMQLDR